MAVRLRAALVVAMVASAMVAPTAQVPTAQAAPAQRWAPAATAAIHPGVVTETAGAGLCTGDFVFTIGATVYLGEAAHCGGTGADTETNGCTSATVPLGTPVTIDAADGSRRSGALAYSSWVTMQAIGETDADTCAYNDLALVRIAQADVADVNPSVPFFGGPTGIDTNGLKAGEMVFTYGNSPARLGVATLSPKVGISASEAGSGRGHAVYTLSPGIAGDSGSAYLSSGGQALGLLATLNLAPLPVSNGVADLAKALDYAEANGGLGPVALALGTQPFTDTPIGVDPALLATPAGPPLGESPSQA
ncbi:MAG: hypothetical protein QOI16_2151 [Pseudonocardiales bacterium]|nr:hypothetical protein [Pseudonocardiales bacterium]